MTRKLLATMIVAMFMITSLSIAFADDGPGGNKRKGKYTYRKVYKACMETGEVASATPTISPADKKRAEWDDIFQNKNVHIELKCVIGINGQYMMLIKLSFYYETLKTRP